MTQDQDTEPKIAADVFIAGTLVDLVAISEDLIESTDWYKWFNDEETTFFMQKHYFPNTKRLQQKYFLEHIEPANDSLQLGIWHRKENILIGMISLDTIDFINSSCAMGGIIGVSAYRNLANYLEACKLIIKHGFDSLNLNRISAGSIRKDQDDIFCRMLGFRHEGVSRSSVYKQGQYHDIYHHSILRSEYYDLDH